MLNTSLLKDPVTAGLLATAITLTISALIWVSSDEPTVFPIRPPGYVPPQIFQDPTVRPVLQLTPYLAPAAWIAFALVAYWKGRIRIIWGSKGYDYDTFKVVARMRGSTSRVRILRSLDLPKNRLQLSKELGMDWKSIDGHVSMLLKFGLIREMVSIGVSNYFIVTERGKEVLELLKEGQSESEDN